MSTDPGRLSVDDVIQIIEAFGETGLRSLSVSIGRSRIDLSSDVGGNVAFSPGTDLGEHPSPAADSPESGDSDTGGTGTSPGIGFDQSDAENGMHELVSGSVPVTAPVVGVFYRRPAPDSPPFVEVGSIVEAGAPIGVLETMKMFTEVKAPVSGTVCQIFVENDVFVEFGEVIATIAPEYPDR